MKKLFNSAMRYQHKISLFFYWMMTAGFVLTGCQKENVATPLDNLQSSKNEVQSVSNVLNDYTGLSLQTSQELQQARAATARYRNIKNALKDGYDDINVVAPYMGYHFMKSSLTDAIFDIRRPEILVFNKDEDGNFNLVAIEYAVPISLSPLMAPEGFTGTHDVWNRNEGFGLWLLHAWVWSYNPDGVFNPTNPLVHLH